jgi:hypothetical protein
MVFVTLTSAPPAGLKAEMISGGGGHSVREISTLSPNKMISEVSVVMGSRGDTPNGGDIVRVERKGKQVGRCMQDPSGHEPETYSTECQRLTVKFLTGVII